MPFVASIPECFQISVFDTLCFEATFHRSAQGMRLYTFPESYPRIMSSLSYSSSHSFTDPAFPSSFLSSVILSRTSLVYLLLLHHPEILLTSFFLSSSLWLFLVCHLFVMVFALCLALLISVPHFSMYFCFTWSLKVVLFLLEELLQYQIHQSQAWILLIRDHLSAFLVSDIAWYPSTKSMISQQPFL